MKKFLSLILALAMVACMSVTAFAADPTTTLTVEVPGNQPSYTLHYEAEVKLEYGNTDKQTVGDVYVTDVSGNLSFIGFQPKYTDLINTTDSTDTISMTLCDQGNEYAKSGLNTYGYEVCLYYPDYAGRDGVDDYGYRTSSLEAQVSDWSGATPGATYKATITYVISTY